MSYQLNRTPSSQALLVLAHGAGAGANSDFMQQLTAALMSQDVGVVTFDFPYMQLMQQTGKRRPPDKLQKLQEHFLSVLRPLASDLPLFIGGKSMGGRVASTLLEQSDAVGAIVFGYPFHPPGKPDALRIAHLQTLTKPMLVIQGQRDTFGNQSQVEQYALSPMVERVFLTDGDHSFKPRKASGITQLEHIQTAARLTSVFIGKQF